MQWVECKCRNKCTENLDIDKRKLLHTSYWSIGSDNKRRQYILAMTSTKDPVQRMTKHKENSRKKQMLVYFLNKNNNDKVGVCANVFFSTLQVTRKFVATPMNMQHRVPTNQIAKDDTVQNTN